MSAPRLTIIYGASDIPEQEIVVRNNAANSHAPLCIDMPHLSIFMSRGNLVRLVDQGTAALAMHKAAHDFHRGAGGAG